MLLGAEPWTESKSRLRVAHCDAMWTMFDN